MWGIGKKDINTHNKGDNSEANNGQAQHNSKIEQQSGISRAIIEILDKTLDDIAKGLGSRGKGRRTRKKIVKK